MDTNSMPSQASKESYTAAVSQDDYGLGRTPGQRGAEILAGVRASLVSSPENMALSRLSGRIVARIMMGMIRNRHPLNFTLARPMVFEGMIKKSLPNDPAPVIVEIAAGLAPRGLMLARKNPHMQVIEVDLPDVVNEKQRRLSRGGITIPTNLKWLSGDLALTPLSKILNGQKAHVVACEGLLPYLTHAQIKQLGQWVAAALHPNGKFIADVPLQSGVREIQQLANFFSRQAGNWYGTLPDAEFGKNLLQDAGFARVDTFVATDFATEFKLPMPMIDVSCFMVATTASA